MHLLDGDAMEASQFSPKIKATSMEVLAEVIDLTDSDMEDEISASAAGDTRVNITYPSNLPAGPSADTRNGQVGIVSTSHTEPLSLSLPNANHSSTTTTLSSNDENETALQTRKQRSHKQNLRAMRRAFFSSFCIESKDSGDIGCFVQKDLKKDSAFIDLSCEYLDCLAARKSTKRFLIHASEGFFDGSSSLAQWINAASTKGSANVALVRHYIPTRFGNIDTVLRWKILKDVTRGEEIRWVFDNKSLGKVPATTDVAGTNAFRLLPDTRSRLAVMVVVVDDPSKQSDKDGAGVVAQRAIGMGDVFQDYLCSFVKGVCPPLIPANGSKGDAYIKTAGKYINLDGSFSEWINDANANGREPNMEFRIGAGHIRGSATKQVLEWRILKPIAEGEELLVDYNARIKIDGLTVRAEYVLK
jgi:hypothetical protein